MSLPLSVPAIPSQALVDEQSLPVGGGFLPEHAGPADRGCPFRHGRWDPSAGPVGGPIVIDDSGRPRSQRGLDRRAGSGWTALGVAGAIHDGDAGGAALLQGGERLEAVLWPDAVDSGFVLERVEGRLWLFHDCGASVGVSNEVSDAQLRWYVTAHRCGPLGSEWHIGAAPEPHSWQRAASPAHRARARRDGRRGRLGVVG